MSGVGDSGSGAPVETLTAAAVHSIHTVLELIRYSQ